jgi:hypothetical protein
MGVVKRRLSVGHFSHCAFDNLKSCAVMEMAMIEYSIADVPNRWECGKEEDLSQREWPSLDDVSVRTLDQLQRLLCHPDSVNRLMTLRPMDVPALIHIIKTYRVFLKLLLSPN